MGRFGRSLSIRWVRGGGSLLVAALCLTSPAWGQAPDPAPPLPPGEAPPATAGSRLESAGTAKDHEGADYVIVHATTENRVNAEGVARGDEYVLYKVLTAAGARDLAVLTWHYEPWSSFVEVREACILRGGERLPVAVDAVRDLPAPQYGIYWNARVKLLQLPRLHVNDGIEIRVFRKGYSYALLDEPDDAKYVPPMRGEYFDVILFEADVPILEKRYTLILPREKRVHAETYNAPLYASTSYDQEETRYSWWARDMAARRSEPRRASLGDFAAKVVVATVESWEAKSRWFFDANRNQFAVTPEIQEKVDEILSAAGVADGSDAAKGEVLVHWVAQNIRYSGQTMGEGEGFTLHPGAMIFAQRSGVCKDIAGMLVTMMRAAGMDSYAAMTMAGSRIEEVPADQFNHCVCALRGPDGSFVMYDPTWVPYMNDIWSKYETEQQYLIGTPEGSPLAEIPYSPPAESPLAIKHEAELLADGTLAGTLRLSGQGAMDGRLRGVVGNRIADVAADIAALLAHVSPAVEDVRVTHQRRDDFSAPMWIEARYRVPGFALPVAAGLEFKSPMMALTMNDGWLFRAGTTDWPEERDSDVFLYFTQLIEGTERIRLPRGFTAELPDSAARVDETYAFFHGQARSEGRDLVITQRVEIRRRQIPVAGYAGYREAIAAARDWEDVVYRVARKEEESR